MKKTNSFILFGRAFKNAKSDFWVSIQVLLVVTVILTIVFYLAEHRAQPEEYRTPLNALVWAATRYIGDPGNFAGNGPVTLIGRYIDTIIGIMDILIFAVPAGLVANGFRKAMEDEKHKNYMEAMRLRVFKAFRQVHSPTFDEYRDRHPEISNHSYFFTPRKVPIAKLEVKGLKLSDILDIVNTYPEFRLKNMATAVSSESQPEDRLVVEHFPLNTDYGYCKDRNSNITIVASSSTAEVGTGWFAYYLAKFGGFNLICKELEVDPDEPDSFSAMLSQIQVDGFTKKELETDPKANRDRLALIDKKQARRESFLNDLKALCKGENSWCIILLSHIKNQTNTNDIHFAHCKKDGSDLAVNDMDAYIGMLQKMQSTMQDEFSITSVQSSRYPLKPSSLVYKVRKDKPEVNGFAVRVSTDIICFDARTHAIMHSMASVINNSFNGQGMQPTDDDMFKKRLFGYTE